MVFIDRHRDAIATALAFAAAESADTRLLLILGRAGVGKTAMIQQLLSDVSSRGHRRCQVVSARDVADDMVDAVRSDTFGELGCQFGRSDFVAIEDVNDLYGRRATLEELGRLIAGWVARGARVVCTIGCSRQGLTDFERRLPPPPVSHVATLKKPARHEMRAILRNLAAAATVDIDRQSLTDLAVWCEGDIRRAVGAVRQLQFEAKYAKRPT